MTDLFVFLGLDVALGGAAAYVIGRALALEWRRRGFAFLACLPLAGAIRFLHFVLFREPLLAPGSFAITFALMIGFAWLGFEVTRSRQMRRLYGFLDNEPKNDQRSEDRPDVRT